MRNSRAKRALLVLVLAIFIMILAFSDSFAQVTVNGEELEVDNPQCCKLKHDISGWGETYSERDWVGAPFSNSPTEVCPGWDGFAYYDNTNWAGYCAVDTAVTVRDIITWIAFVATGLAIVFAGITFVTAVGDPNKIEKAKKILLTSLVGVLVIVLAQFIPGLIRYFIGI